jgi:uncharacterized phiE125 gp8 family phage protein
LSTIKVLDASTEPVSLAEAKLHLRVDHDEEDGLIQGLITAARQLAEGEMQRTLISTTWQMTTDAFGDALRLEWPRVLGVESLQFVAEDGQLATLDPADYVLDNSNDVSPAYLVPAFGCAWPATRAEINAVRVRYVAGFGSSPVDVPQQIKQWILLHVGAMYANREAVAGKQMTALPYLCGLLEPFKVYG